MPAKKPSTPTSSSHSFASVIAKSGGTTDASLSLLNELGLKNGEWCFQSKPVLERIMEWYEHAPLFIRVLACVQIHTLGYLPSSGGVVAHKGEAGKVVFALDERRHSHCKVHGALLAVTQTGKGKRVAIGPNHIRNEVNEAAIRAFERQEEREATQEEKDSISATAPHIRRVIDYLEELGLCLRTDNEDAPLSELRKTEEGRAKLKTLSGDNKIRVYLYLRPKASNVPQGSHMRLPSQVISNELKPLYKLFLGLKLDLDPTAFSFDGDLQATIRAELDERAKLIAERDEALKAAILQKYPSAQISAASNDADQHSTGLNPTEKEGGLTDTERSIPANRKPVDSTMGTEAPLMSRPRRSAVPASSPGAEHTLPASRSSTPPSSLGGRESLSDAWIDQAFRDQVIAAFVGGNKPVPTMKQIAQLQKALPDDQEARLTFVSELRRKMPQFKGPGVLASEAESFTAAWPVIVAKKQAEFAQQMESDQIAVERQEQETADRGNPLTQLVRKMQWMRSDEVRSKPKHPFNVAVGMEIAQAEIETPELYREALQQCEEQLQKRVS